jgi:hypothetical protein
VLRVEENKIEGVCSHLSSSQKLGVIDRLLVLCIYSLVKQSKILSSYLIKLSTRARPCGELQFLVGVSWVTLLHHKHWKISYKPHPGRGPRETDTVPSSSLSSLVPSAWATITKYHSLGSLNNKNWFSLTILEADSPSSKCGQGWVFLRPLFGLETPVFSLHLHMISSLYTAMSKFLLIIRMFVLLD